MKKRRKVMKRIKRAHIWPLFMVMLLMVNLIFTAVMMIVLGYVDNMTRGRFVLDYIKGERLYLETIQRGIENREQVEELTDQYADIMGEYLGLTVLVDDEELYHVGQDMPVQSTVWVMEADDIVDVEMIRSEYEADRDYSGRDIGDMAEGFAEGIRVNLSTMEILAAEDGNHDMCDLYSPTGTIDAEELVKMFVDGSKNITSDQSKVRMTTPILKQDCWYTYQYSEDTSVVIGYTSSIMLQDMIHGIVLVAAFAILTFVFCVIFLAIIIWSLVAQKRLIKVYYGDNETGGNNWYYFLDEAQKKMRRLRRKQIPVALIDIHMAKYHDYCACYGEEEGRKLLSNFYYLLRRSLPSKTVFARAETADFGILLPGKQAEEVRALTAELMQKMAQVNPGVTMHFAAGIYMYDGETYEVSEMYNRASTARKELPDDHSETIAFYTQKMLEDLQWERKVENDMERALVNHEYAVYLQPKYSVKGEKLSAAEALVRWIHPTEGFIPPYRFIPIFEKNGFILKLDDYMVSEVAALQAKWIAEGKKVVPVSVNLSRAHFAMPNLAEHICALVDKYNVPHEVIELELTESAFFDDKASLIATVRKMQAYGFAVSMDDFGAGYSSLNSLRELPVDVVKLDAEFFRGDDSEGKGKIIISEAISIAKQLKMQIVAEGIETREQVDFLAQQDCDLIQGYYFAKPMPAGEFEERL